MRYTAYSQHLRNKYGEKTYKIPINIAADCPNRDGRIGVGGCIFCGEKGAGFENLPSSLSVSEQLRENISYIGKKYHAAKFSAYFQNFTNTYIPFESLTAYCCSAASFPEVVELCFSTRPDCLPQRYLEEMARVADVFKKDVCIELGLQTANYHTLAKINRGHSLAEFIDAVQRVKKMGFSCSAHVILNLPWDEDEDMIETAKILSALNVDYVKLHSLYIEKNTPLATLYENQEINLITLEQYVSRAVTFLEYLDPGIAIQRLVGRAPAEDTLFCNWNTSWWKIRDMISAELESRDTFQGKKFTYLGGIEYGK